MTYTTGLRTGEASGFGVKLECTDHLARFWTMEAFETGMDQVSLRPHVLEAKMASVPDGAIDTRAISKLYLPSGLVNALADAFGDPDHRYQRKCRDLEAELKRAHEVIRALSGAVGGMYRPPATYTGGDGLDMDVSTPRH